MTAFLAWVFSQANKVYDWFGDGYHDLKNTVVNTLAWILYYAGQVLTSAYAYAYNLVNKITGDIQNVYDYVTWRINQAWNGLLEDIRGVYDWVEYRLSGINGIVQSILSGIWQSITDFVFSLTNGLHLLINNSIQWIYDFIDNNFGWINDIRGAVLDLLSIFSVDTFVMLANFITQWRDAILSFFSDPVGFIFDVIQGKVLTFLDYVLGWALGAVDNDLDPNPTWKD